MAEAFQDDRHQLLFLPDRDDIDTITELERLRLEYSIAPDAPAFGRPTYATKINHAYRTTTRPYLLYVGDDITPEDGWWDAALVALEDERVGLLATNDGVNYQNSNGRLATHGIVRRSYVERYGSASLADAGPIFWEGYGHWCVDAEASYVARVRGAFGYAPDSVLRHTRGKFDSTYRLGQSRAKADRANLRVRCPTWPLTPDEAGVPPPEPPSRARAPGIIPRERPLTVTLMSAAERRSTREDTLKQLARVGLVPIIILNTPTPENARIAPEEAARYQKLGYEVIINGEPDRGYGGRNNLLAARDAVRTALDRKTDLLYFEDDVDVHDDIHWFIREASEVTDAVTWFYTHDGRGDKLLAARYGLHVWEKLKHCMSWHEPFPRGLYRIRDSRKVNSGQAIYFPHEMLLRLPVAELDVGSSPFDMWAQKRASQVGPLLVGLPHPVQHRHDRTGRSPSANANKFSQSFDLR
jgi:hypothetical protein